MFIHLQQLKACLHLNWIRTSLQTDLHPIHIQNALIAYTLPNVEVVLRLSIAD